VFGGQSRINRLDLHFKRVSSSATISILSFGYTDVIRKALERTNLPYFDSCVVIGKDSDELNKAGSKAKCVSNMKKELHLKSDQVLFVDDDNTNLQRAAPYCDTLHIYPRTGMTEGHMRQIEEACGVYPKLASVCVTSPRTVDAEATKKYSSQKIRQTNDSDNSNSNSNNNNDNSNSNTDNSSNSNSNSNSNSSDNQNNSKSAKNDWKEKYNIDVPLWFDKLAKPEEDSTPVIQLKPGTPSDSEEPYVLIVPSDLRTNTAVIEADAASANDNQPVSTGHGISLQLST
jgi:hypothetical protein